MDAGYIRVTDITHKITMFYNYVSIQIVSIQIALFLFKLFAPCDFISFSRYAADVSFGIAGLTLACPTDLDACTAERCACDLEYGMVLSDTLQSLLTGDNPQGLDNSKMGLEDIDCERALSGIGTNGCCGHAPHWQLYNAAAQTCVNGVLEDIE